MLPPSCTRGFRREYSIKIQRPAPYRGYRGSFPRAESGKLTPPSVMPMEGDGRPARCAPAMLEPCGAYIPGSPMQIHPVQLGGFPLNDASSPAGKSREQLIKASPGEACSTALFRTDARHGSSAPQLGSE